MKNGYIDKPESILTTAAMPLDLMLSQFVTQSKSVDFDFKSLNIALEIVSLIDKIEAELIMENANV